MGAVRHRQLIHVLATFVALDMAVGVVALSARRGGRDGVGTALVAGSVSIPLNDQTGTGILAGANLKERRGLNDRPGATGSLEAAPTTSSSVTTATTSPLGPPDSAEQPVTSTSSAPDGTTRRQRGEGRRGGRSSAADDTAGTEPMPGGPAPTSSSPTTVDSTRSPGTTATTRPEPASTTATTTRPSATTAPADPTTTTQPPAAAQRRDAVTLNDPAGDTFVDGTQKAIKEPRADIVRAVAAYRSGLIAFVMQVQQPVDPRTDERWAGDATFAVWSLDTNGDGQPEFDIQYYALDGQLGGVVSRPNSTDVVCDIEGAYGPDGYTAIVDPACLGNPPSISYRVTMYYDTNPKDDNADVASDVTPNGGMSMAVARPS